MSPFRVLFLAGALLAAGTAVAADGYWQAVAATVAAKVAEAEAAAAKGQADVAKRALNDAYFQKFEDGKLEAAIRKEIAAKRAVEVEQMFAGLRKAVSAGDQAAVARGAGELRAAITADARTLDAAKVPPEVFQVNK
ncbi:MAG: hypothetical protein ACM31L_03795 [Actinomycetota bacterium]